jgi:hypothetical protein
MIGGILLRHPNPAVNLGSLRRFSILLLRPPPDVGIGLTDLLNFL